MSPIKNESQVRVRARFGGRKNVQAINTLFLLLTKSIKLTNMNNYGIKRAVPSHVTSNTILDAEQLKEVSTL